MKLEEKYLIKQRVNEDIKKYGSTKNAISYLKKELKEYEDIFSNYYYDCVGHAIICTELKIKYLEKCLIKV